MFNELNFIIRNNHDEDGLTEELINEIGRNYKIGKGIVYDANPGVRCQVEGIDYRSVTAISRHDCLELHKKCLALDGDILDAMLPYKSMAMHIMMRESHYDVYDRAYLEKVYYRHLRYWYTVIETNNINAIFYLVIPHHCGEYILYALSRVLDIPVVMLYPQISHDGILCFLGDSLESIGNNIGDIYEGLTDAGALNKYMSNVVDKIEKNTIMVSGKREDLLKDVYNMMHQYVGVGSILKDSKMLMLIKLNIIKRVYKEDSINTYKRLIKLKYKIRKYLRKMDTIKTYREFSVMPQKKDRYLYFPLQTTPEASTMPLAREFKEQLLGIEMIADVAKKYNLFVYVKEHWSQLYRRPGFYKDLQQIENVKIIDENVNSIDLIENSVAVVNMTGNCLFEALIKGKPAIAVGKGATFKKAPHLIYVNNKKDVDYALDNIINGKIVVKKEEMLKYCVAIQKGAVYSYVDRLSEASRYYVKEDTAHMIVEYFKQYSRGELRDANSIMGL